MLFVYCIYTRFSKCCSCNVYMHGFSLRDPCNKVIETNRWQSEAGILF